MRGSRLHAVLLMVGAMVVLTPGVAEAASRTNCNGSLAAGRVPARRRDPPNAACFAGRRVS